jgi:hypothetical protein
VSPAHEHDHFPIPRRAGGWNWVASCQNCHDFKDRVPYDAWPVEFAVPALAELLPIFFGPGAPLHAVEPSPRELLPWPMVVAMKKNWEDLSPMSRLLAAKWTAMAFTSPPKRTLRRRGRVA